MIVSVSPEADRELAGGARYYAREGGTALGMALIEEYERGLAVLRGHPEIGALWKNGRRRLPLRKFPYSVVYYIRGEEIRVIALAHHRRQPEYWVKRK